MKRNAVESKKRGDKNVSEAFIEKKIEGLRKDLLIEMDGVEVHLTAMIKGVVTEVGQVIKEEIASLGRSLKKDLTQIMKQESQETRDFTQALVEEVREDVGGANRDQILLMRDIQRKHDKEIKQLQKKIGIR